MKKLIIGLVAASAVAGVALPAAAQVSIHIGPHRHHYYHHHWVYDRWHHRHWR